MLVAQENALVHLTDRGTGFNDMCIAHTWEPDGCQVGNQVLVLQKVEAEQVIIYAKAFLLYTEEDPPPLRYSRACTA